MSSAIQSLPSEHAEADTLLGTAALSLPRDPALLRIQDYAELIKARVTSLVVMTAWCGYYFGSFKSGISSLSMGLFHALLGIGLVAGGTAALNEVIEHDIDGKMRRTAIRPLPGKRMSLTHATLLGAVMTLGGAAYLMLATNVLTGGLALATAAIYLGVYTPLKKMHPICTFVGAFPGAMPGVLGLTAARGRLDWGALVLFAIVFFWQFPHFHSIAWLYREDYDRGGIRMLPVVEPDGRSTARDILLYSAALTPTAWRPVSLIFRGGSTCWERWVLDCSFLVWLAVVAAASSSHGSPVQSSLPSLAASHRVLSSLAVRPDDDQYGGTIELIVTPGTHEPRTSVAEAVVATFPSARREVIVLDNLRHRYDGRVALDGVSFDVRHAELFGLLGPNGSGKTTLFRILSTLMLPSEGHAIIMGHDAAGDPSGLRREIGVVFQAQSIDVKLSAAENLRHQGHLYGLSGIALTARIQEMLERVGLADRAKERAETFSGGMQRRLELAKGLLHHPSVLLLDEPTTGLDPGARRDLWQYLRILRDQEHVTVLVTTHLMEEAERCDRLAILNEGKLVALGTPGELKGEIGGDVILLEADQPDSLADRIRIRFHADASVMGGKIRIERENGHRFVTDLVEAFAGEIQSVLVSKPTLEDVFIRRTGYRFWAENHQGADSR